LLNAAPTALILCGGTVARLMEMYPIGSEKELYAKFAHILLSAPSKTILADEIEDLCKLT